MSDKISNNKIQFLSVCGLILFCPLWLMAQIYKGSPVQKDRLIKVIKSQRDSTREIVAFIKESGVDFEVTSEVEAELLAVNTRRQIIDAARDNFRETKKIAPKATTVSTPKTSTIQTSTSLVQNDNSENNKAEKYEQLYNQAIEMLGQLRTATNQQQLYTIAQNVQKTSLDAIKLDATRPDAYKIIGYLYLLAGNVTEAESYGQQAIDRGGSLGFTVYHLAGTPHLEKLYIGKGYISIESSQKYFTYNTQEVNFVQPQGYYNLNGVNVAAFGIATFQNGQRADWYFAPADTGTVAEANLIMKFIQRNAMASR